MASGQGLAKIQHLVDGVTVTQESLLQILQHIGADQSLVSYASNFWEQEGGEQSIPLKRVVEWAFDQHAPRAERMGHKLLLDPTDFQSHLSSILRVFRFQGSIKDAEERGVSLDQLSRVFDFVDGHCRQWRDTESHAVLSSEMVNLRHTNEWLIQPATSLDNCAFVELLVSEPQVPSWFCSQSCEEFLRSCLECLESHVQGRGLRRDTIYWMCALAVRQHSLQNSMADSHVDSCFIRAMRLSSGVLLVLGDEAIEAAVFTRIWCFYEDFAAECDQGSLAGGRRRMLLDVLTPAGDASALSNDGRRLLVDDIEEREKTQGLEEARLSLGASIEGGEISSDISSHSELNEVHGGVAEDDCEARASKRASCHSSDILDGDSNGTKKDSDNDVVCNPGALDRPSAPSVAEPGPETSERVSLEAESFVADAHVEASRRKKKAKARSRKRERHSSERTNGASEVAGQVGDHDSHQGTSSDSSSDGDVIGGEMSYWEPTLGKVQRPGWLPDHGPRNLEVPPEEWGMTLQQWAAFILACFMGNGVEGGGKLEKLPRETPLKRASMDVNHVNLYQITDEFVKPWTRNRGSSIALLMNNDRPLKAQVMISHAWGECIIESMVAVLGKAFSMSISLSTIVWFCAFAQYQPGGEAGDCGPTVEEQLALDPFKRVIASKPPYGMLVIHTTRAEVYDRLWCVYEVNVAANSAVTPQAAVSMNYLVDYYLKRAHGGKTSDDLCRVDTKRATCWSEDDSTRIRNEIEHGAGYHALDKEITDFRKSALDQMFNSANAFFQWAQQAQMQGDEKKLVFTLRDKVRSAGVYVGLHCLMRQCDAAGFTDERYRAGILRLARKTVGPLEIPVASTGARAPTPPFFDPAKRTDETAFLAKLLDERDDSLLECLRDLSRFPMPVAYLEMGAGGKVGEGGTGVMIRTQQITVQSSELAHPLEGDAMEGEFWDAFARIDCGLEPLRPQARDALRQLQAAVRPLHATISHHHSFL